jgi:hypothetical protein
MTKLQCYLVTISMGPMHIDDGVDAFRKAPGVFEAERSGDNEISVYVKPDDQSVNSFVDWVETTIPRPAPV